MLEWFDYTLKANVEHYGLLAIYITMLLESACIPIPSEVVMPFAGFLVAKGKVGMVQAGLVGSLANLSGSWLAYAAGRYGGRSFLHKYGRYIFLSEKHLQQAEDWFAAKGEVMVFVSRMLPGIRTFISLPAGMAEMDFIKFSIFSFVGSVPWNFALVYLGYQFTNRLDQLQVYLHKFNIVVIAVVVLLAAVYLLFRKFKSKKSD